MTANTANGSNFSRYWYANNNPYRFTDPDGRESRAIREMERQIDAFERGDISEADLNRGHEIRAVGAIIGLAAVVNPVGIYKTGKWMLKTPTRRAWGLAIMHRLSKNSDEREKLGTRTQEQAVEVMKAAKETAQKEVKALKPARPPDPPKPPEFPKPPEPPRPPKPPNPQP